MSEQRVSWEEFRERGYLQELNRRFLHPLGMALTLESLPGGIWEVYVQDARDDPEGFVFGFTRRPPHTWEESRRKQDDVDDEWRQRFAARVALFGRVIEPIPVNHA